MKRDLCYQWRRFQQFNAQFNGNSSIESLGFKGSMDSYPELITSHIARVQLELGYSFQDVDLLYLALTHSSFFNEQTGSEGNGIKVLGDNERLEFLGDAVIGLIVARRLMELFPKSAEGELSRLRSALVSRKSLSELGAKVGMNHWVLLGRGERKSGGENKSSILAGVFESVIGAIYLDGGVEPATRYLLSVYEPLFQGLLLGGEKRPSFFDQKTLLQEKTQATLKTTPQYRLVDSWGREHEKEFRVEVELKGQVIAEGLGKSKKEAEQFAAQNALLFLEKTNGNSI